MESFRQLFTSMDRIHNSIWNTVLSTSIQSARNGSRRARLGGPASVHSASEEPTPTSLSNKRPNALRLLPRVLCSFLLFRRVQKLHWIVPLRILLNILRLTRK